MKIPSWNFVRVPMLWAHKKNFQLDILTVNVICGIVYFRDIILESSWNVSETTPNVPEIVDGSVSQVEDKSNTFVSGWG